MTQKLLVDTDILIDVSRDISVAKDRLKLEARTAGLSISVITKMELIVGCRNKTELQHLEHFLLNFALIEINESVSQKATELLALYRLSHNLLIPDALIAATTLENSFPLLSKNQRDYRFISGLNLLPYP